MKEFFDKLDKANVVPVFGLEAQGHIPTIEAILNDLGSCDYAWEKIAKKIGWCDKAARDHYITYLMERGQKDETGKSNCTIDGVIPSLPIAKIIGQNEAWPLIDVLKKLVEASEILLHRKNYDGHGWEEISKCVDRAKRITSLLDGNEV